METIGDLFCYFTQMAVGIFFKIISQSVEQILYMISDHGKQKLLFRNQKTKSFPHKKDQQLKKKLRKNKIDTQTFDHIIQRKITC